MEHCAQYPLFDSHCHFDFLAFEDDRQAVMERAFKLNVEHIMVPGVHPDQWASATLVAKKVNANQLARIHLALGLHPWWFKSWLDEQGDESLSAALESLRNQLQLNSKRYQYKAIGETGLDALMLGNKSLNIETQQAIVKAHLRIANELQLPVILHCRKAHNQLLQLINDDPLSAGGVLHGFSGSYQLAKQYFDKGILIGVGGTITYPRASKTREAVKSLPSEALVLETDSPDMPLSGRQGERNSPEYLIDVAKALASLRGETLAEVCNYSFQNTCKLFVI